MAKSPKDILERWRENVPPETPKEDVERVVEFYFPGMFRYQEGTSHWLSITDPMLAKADAAGYDTGTTKGSGRIQLAHKHGRTVKKVYVSNLVTAINLKEAIEKAKLE